MGKTAETQKIAAFATLRRRAPDVQSTLRVCIQQREFASGQRDLDPGLRNSQSYAIDNIKGRATAGHDYAHNGKGSSLE